MLDPDLVFLAASAASIAAAAPNFDGYAEGPLGTGGCKCTAAWRDARGFHRFYAVGFATPELAREAALDGAKDLGYRAPRAWEFWKERIALR